MPQNMWDCPTQEDKSVGQDPESPALSFVALLLLLCSVERDCGRQLNEATKGDPPRPQTPFGRQGKGAFSCLLRSELGES